MEIAIIMNKKLKGLSKFLTGVFLKFPKLKTVLDHMKSLVPKL